MMVESVLPGVSRDDVVKNTGFELLWSKNVLTSEPPTDEGIRVLREEVDPIKYIVGRQAA